MAESKSENSNSEFVSKPREEEEELLHATERKEESKKRKNKSLETPSDESESLLPSPMKVKLPPFSKVWSDEDEISILRGMIDFKYQTDRDAETNMPEFRLFILPSLIRQATLVQLREKVRRLKYKYKKSLERGNGDATQHEVKLYQLCHRIWAEQHNSSQQNIIEHQNIVEKQNIQESGRAREPIIEQHNIMPVTGLNRQTLDALWKRVSNDIQLVVNSKACLHGNQKEVNLRVVDLSSQSMKLSIKLCKLVAEKTNSPVLQDFPEVLEQEVLRAYLKAKMEHAQLLFNAYNSFIKDHTSEDQSSAATINK